MRSFAFVPALASLAVFVLSFIHPTLCPAFDPPGTDESAAVDRANEKIDRVYKRLMSELDSSHQKQLREEEREWIKWRDEEAERIAREGGAEGGSALRVDFLKAQLRLIKERTAALEDRLKE